MMKKLLMAAPLSLALAMVAGTAAAADPVSGTIYFTGEIKSGTCAIEVTNPGSPPGSPIYLGQHTAANFKSVGDELGTQAFTLRVDPSAGCTIEDGVATVNFTSQDGADSINPQLHSLRPGSAAGIAVAIRDDRDKRVLGYGDDSVDFATQDGKPLTMQFTAGYMSTLAAASITSGDAYADVNFTVTLP